MLESSKSHESTSKNGNGSEGLKESIENHLKYSQAKNWQTSTPLDQYYSVALTVRDRLVERWINTQHEYHEKDRQLS